MASSQHTPLLGTHSSPDVNEENGAAKNSESTRCLFDQVTSPFKKLFSGHNLAVVSGPVATIIIFFIGKYHGFDDGSGDMAASSKKIGAMLGALVWMALWWILEPVPIAITSLLPLVLFPFFEVMDADTVAGEYMNDTVTLMLGTFILALCINKYAVHKRLALKILLLVGGEEMNPRLVLLGFIVGPAFVSMWMSNTSAAAMMIPMAIGLLENLVPEHHVERTRSFRSMQLEESQRRRAKEDGVVFEHDNYSDVDAIAKEVIRVYSQGVIIGVTYGVGVGGMITTIGCGANLVFPGIYSGRFPDAPPITFLNWMYFALPLVLPWMILMWLYLSWKFCPQPALHVIASSLNREVVIRSYKELGPIAFAEIFILCEFLIIVVLWVTRSFGESPGWGQLFSNFPDAGTVSILGAVLLFVVPNNKKQGEMLLNWKNCKEISWSVILLLGGGFALSAGLKTSGVSTWITIHMEWFEDVPYYLLIPVLSVILSALTEFSSNAAIATLFLPIFAEVALSINIHPLLLMIATTFASNYAFILPSGTPPNAIATGTGYVKVNDMAQPGFFMHVVGILLLSVLLPTLGGWIFGLNTRPSSLPYFNS